MPNLAHAALVIALSILGTVAHAAEPLKHPDGINTWEELPPSVRADVESGRAWTRPFKTPDDKQGAEGFVILPFSRDEIWDLLYDLKSYPSWKRIYKEITKLEWKDANNVILGYSTAGAISFDIAQERRYIPKTQIVMKSLPGGKIKDNDSMYELRDLGNGKTLLRFWSTGRTDGWVPGFIKKYIATEGVQNDFEDITKEVMRRRKAKGTGLAPAQ